MREQKKKYIQKGNASCNFYNLLLQNLLNIQNEADNIIIYLIMFLQY